MQTATLNALGQRRGGRGGPRMQRMARKAERARVAAMTPEQRAALEAEKAKAAIFAARRKENSYIYRPANTGWSVVAPGPLSPIGKEFQKIILARDWDALFQYLPLKYWGRYDTLGKYSFRDRNGVRTYIPFSEGDIRSFVFSPYYTVQPGYTCSDEQRGWGVAANLKGMVRHGQKFRNTDARRIWPIFPGWGYGGEQRYGCETVQKSTWVKIRKGVVVAVAVVAAVYLGPAILAKVKSVAGGILGGGAEAGAAAQATTFQKIQAGTKTLLGYVNKARTVDAIVKGKLPPPPIGIPGASFRDWALIVAKEKIEAEAIDYAMEKGVEYIQKKMTAKEEAKLKAEIAEMQRQLIALTPPEILKMPPEPDPELATPIKRIQVIEEKRAADLQKFIVPGAIIAGALMLGV